MKQHDDDELDDCKFYLEDILKNRMYSAEYVINKIIQSNIILIDRIKELEKNDRLN